MHQVNLILDIKKIQTVLEKYRVDGYKWIDEEETEENEKKKQRNKF
jgi:hypothetical protein